MKKKNVICWSIILLFIIVLFAECNMNDQVIINMDTNKTEYHDRNIINDTVAKSYAKDPDTSGYIKPPVVYVDTDGTGNYNCDGTNDHIEINIALSEINSMDGGTVYLRGSNTYWIDSTLVMGANTILTGDSDACVKLVPNANPKTTWGIGVPMICNIYGADNLTVSGFEIDGNSESQSVSSGLGYHNMIYFKDASNVEVSHMRLEWGRGEGLRTEECRDVKFLYNDVYKIGHDGVYYIFTNNTETAYNTVYTRTNSATRAHAGNNISVHDNIFHSEYGNDFTGPVIEFDKLITGTETMKNIEVFNNKVYTNYAAGIMIAAKYPDDAIRCENISIHHNTFTNMGSYPITEKYSNAAIVIGNANNTRIEHNVIDGGGRAGVLWYPRGSPTQKAQFYVYVRNNIIMNSKAYARETGSGAAIWNDNTTYVHFIVENNCLYNNELGNTYPSSGAWLTMSNNLNVDPLFYDAGAHISPGSRDYHLKSKAGRWTGTTWAYDSVSSPLIDAGLITSPYSLEPSPNGGRVNIGRYGNTEEASKSVSSTSATDTKPLLMLALSQGNWDLKVHFLVEQIYS